VANTLQLDPVVTRLVAKRSGNSAPLRGLLTRAGHFLIRDAPLQALVVIRGLAPTGFLIARVQRLDFVGASGMASDLYVGQMRYSLPLNQPARQTPHPAQPQARCTDIPSAAVYRASVPP